jgi:hypothetical protein
MLRFGAFKVSEMLFFHKRSIVAVEVVFCHPKNGKLWKPTSKHVAQACIDRFTCADFHKTKFSKIIFHQ